METVSFKITACSLLRQETTTGDGLINPEKGAPSVCRTACWDTLSADIWKFSTHDKVLRRDKRKKERKENHSVWCQHPFNSNTSCCSTTVLCSRSHVTKFMLYTAELGYNIMKEIEHFVLLQTSVVLIVTNRFLTMLYMKNISIYKNFSHHHKTTQNNTLHFRSKLFPSSGLVVSPEEEGSLLLRHGVLF
jgi:hypothetical protein